MAMKKIMLALPEEMLKVLEKERKERYLQTMPETIRAILSEYKKKLKPFTLCHTPNNSKKKVEVG